MKPLAYGLGLFLALLAFCLGAAALLCEKSGEAEAALRQAYDAARGGDMALAQTCALRAKDCWDRNTPLLDALTSHEETDEIRRDFSELLEYAKAGQREQFLALCARLTVQTAHLRQMERACWYNILTAKLFKLRLFSANGLYISK